LHKFKKALVTRGAGFIGSHIVDRLIRDGCEVTVLDDLSTGNLQNLKDSRRSSGLKIVKGDVRDAKRTGSTLKNVDVIFHEAAIVSVSRSVREPRVVEDVNVGGTLNLLRCAAKEGVEKFVLASSAAVYGNAKSIPVSEKTKPSPISPYGLGKLRAEKLCFEFQRDYNLATTVLRYFNVYGPRSTSGEYSGVISRFAEALRANRPLVIYGSGRQTRDFVHVGDVVLANILAASKKVSAGKVFNVASARCISIEGLAKLEAGLVLGGERAPQLEYGSARPGDIEKGCADISKIRDTMGFEPRITLEKGLATFLGNPSETAG
jgi:UDP-glucose 4-epimerase